MVAAAAAAMAAAASFGGYTVVQELGKGGFATVYLATQDTTGEAYAIKQFTSENGRDIDEDKATNERAVLERLGDHEHVVRLCDIVDDPVGVQALVLEYMGGGDLINFIKALGEAGGTEREG